jgi:hypothetical protein
MSNIFCVNKSGVSVPVYSNQNEGQRIGTIGNREAFGYYRDWGGDGARCNIIFLNSSGSLSYGCLLYPPDGTLTPCTSYPYGKAIINGMEYTTFIMRRARNVYKVDESLWGTVAANRKVACQTGMSGENHPDWKGINYVESTSGAWVRVTGAGSNYGFVDAGLGVASGYSSIPMYGRW